jgi:hypothetical protein
MQRLQFLSQTITQAPFTIDNLQTLRLENANSVATIWFNKEASLNAVSYRMIQEFLLALPYLDSLS